MRLLLNCKFAQKLSKKHYCLFGFFAKPVLHLPPTMITVRQEINLPCENIYMPNWDNI